MSDDPKYKKYNHSQVIGQHISNLSTQASNLEGTEIDKWGKYIHEIYLGISYLDAMLDPFKDDQFEEIFTEEMSFPSRKGAQIQFVHSALKQYFNLLHRNNLFYAERTGRRKT